MRCVGRRRLGEIIAFDVERDESDDSRIPTQLATVEPMNPSEAVRTREFVFGPSPDAGLPPVRWTINGRSFDPNDVDVRPRLGDLEIWHLVNQVDLGAVGMDHPVHIHLVNFQILDRDGVPPAPYEQGWKDTLLLPKGGQARVMMRFDGFTGRYVFHCHNLDHEDHDMMGQFEVV